MDSATTDKAAASGGTLARLALRFTDFAERWFPDAFVFVAIAVAIVVAGALLNGAEPKAIASAFGDGYWSLLVFTMQMALMVVSGYVVAVSGPVERLITWIASLPKTGRGAITLTAAMSMAMSLIGWAMSLVFGAVLVRALGRRKDLQMDYRAAGAAAYLGLGATWALGISSSAAQLQANPGSMPKSLLEITGVIPLTQTIFLWQSMVMMLLIFALSVTVANLSAPSPDKSLTADDMGIDLTITKSEDPPPSRPGEWLEYSPILTLLLVGISVLWFVHEFQTKSVLTAVSNLNTYNFFFITLGLLLHWRPRNFLKAVQKAMPATGGILIQFPLYGAIAAILTQAKNAAGISIADQIAHAFVSVTTQHTFPIAVGVYSAVLGMFIPSGGGKWLLEAPYVMQAANELQVHLGWTVQIYNAAEALPNLINPFFMLPLLSIVALKVRDIVGFTFLQFLLHTPFVLFLLWLFAMTLTYTPPVMPG
ncbi:MAG: short-chain fatty acid transporter [Hyphomicrobium sp.]